MTREKFQELKFFHQLYIMVSVAHTMSFLYATFFFFLDDVRLPVTVEDFPKYCKEMHANSDHLFSEEYELSKSHDHMMMQLLNN